MSKYFNKDAVQKRIEEKIARFRKAIDCEEFRATLDKMPVNAETLAIIEAELETVVKGIEADSSHEKWWKFSQAMGLEGKNKKGE